MGAGGVLAQVCRTDRFRDGDTTVLQDVQDQGLQRSIPRLDQQLAGGFGVAGVEQRINLFEELTRYFQHHTHLYNKYDSFFDPDRRQRLDASLANRSKPL
jgi:hypothetical protein